MAHFLETLFGTKHPSFVIGRTPTPEGPLYGPTMFQGDNPPNPLVDSIALTCRNGDLWIQTGPTPALNQYIANSWVTLVSNPGGAALANVVYVDSGIANAVNGLASVFYVDTSLANLVATVALADGTATANAIANAVSGLASTSYVNGQLNMFTSTLAQISLDLVTNAVAGLASLAYVDVQISNVAVRSTQTAGLLIANAVANAMIGLASTQYVDSRISSMALDVRALRNPSLLTVSTVAGAAPPDGSLLAPYPTVQAAVDAATAGPAGAVVIQIMPGMYVENVTVARAQTTLTGLAGAAAATCLCGPLTVMLSGTIGLAHLSLATSALDPGPVCLITTPPGVAGLIDFDTPGDLGNNFVQTSFLPFTAPLYAQALTGGITGGCVTGYSGQNYGATLVYQPVPQRFSQGPIRLSLSLFYDGVLQPLIGPGINSVRSARLGLLAAPTGSFENGGVGLYVEIIASTLSDMRTLAGVSVVANGSSLTADIADIASDIFPPGYTLPIGHWYQLVADFALTAANTYSIATTLFDLGTDGTAPPALVPVTGNAIATVVNADLGDLTYAGFSVLADGGMAKADNLGVPGANAALAFCGDDLHMASQAGSGLLDTAPSPHTVSLRDSTITVQSGAGAALALANTTATLRGTALRSVTGPCLLQNSGSSHLDACLLTAAADGSGVVIANGSTVTVQSTTFDIANGTGFAVQGDAGAVLQYAGLVFMPGSNTKVSAIMTIVPLDTVVTLV